MFKSVATNSRSKIQKMQFAISEARKSATSLNVFVYLSTPLISTLEHGLYSNLNVLVVEYTVLVVCK